MALLLGILGLMGYEYGGEIFKGAKTELQKIEDETSGVQKFFSYIGVAFQYVWRTMKSYLTLVWDVLSGNAYQIYGLAPYISIIGQIYSLVYIVPDDIAQVINSPFILLGADPEYLYFFPLISFVYWFLLIVFNIYSANVDVRIEKKM